MKTIALLLVVVAMPALGEIRSDQPLAPAVFGAAPARQESARVASDGTNFFAVWRAQTAPYTVVIGGGRLSPAGELLDRPSILFASGSEFTIGKPDVVFIGGNFLVVYQVGMSLMIRRFSRDGRPVDSQPVVISNQSMYAPLATNGKNVFLATAPYRFLLLAPDGTPLGPEHVIPSAGSSSMSVASNGDRYLIAYTQSAEDSLHGAFVIVDGNGDFLLSRPIQLPNGLYPGIITVASNASSFLIVMATNGGVGSLLVDGTGNAIVLRILDKEQSSSGVAASWTGSEYTLVWPRTRLMSAAILGHDVVGARVDAAGVPLDNTPVTIAPLQVSRYSAAFASAWNGRDTIIITGDYGGNYTAWHTTAAIFRSLPQIDAEPANRRRVAIASSAVEQASGSIASNGTLSLVAWRETSGLDQAVCRAAFIAADGEMGTPIDLGEVYPETPTATISNGRDFLVAYLDPRSRLVARRVTIEGVLDSTPIVITDFGFLADAIALGWSGQAYVVATAGANAVTISGITPDGAVVIPRQLVEAPVAVDTPAVSCAASGCSVTWHLASPFCGFPVCSSAENDLLARTTAAGNLVSQIVLASFPGITSALSIPASDGKSVFVYSKDRSMFAGRVTSGGLLLDQPASNILIMTSATSFPLQPVAVVGTGLYLIELDDPTNGRLYWSRIETEPPRATSLTNLHQKVTLPLTLTSSARNTYFLYSRGDDDQNFMAPRLFLRTIASPDPQTSPVRRHAAH
ncbi:MAG TPA: hypothetical protein VGQ46_09980 [Thermoanaerobaculia bacterium]|jgi:hypothetical protein|nr:hypothetical protein [Thermoanaerobaculia bacterium]